MVLTVLLIVLTGSFNNQRPEGEKEEENPQKPGPTDGPTTYYMKIGGHV